MEISQKFQILYVGNMRLDIYKRQPEPGTSTSDRLQSAANFLTWTHTNQRRLRGHEEYLLPADNKGVVERSYKHYINGRPVSFFLKQNTTLWVRNYEDENKMWWYREWNMKKINKECRRVERFEPPVGISAGVASLTSCRGRKNETEGNDKMRLKRWDAESKLIQNDYGELMQLTLKKKLLAEMLASKKKALSEM